MKKMKKVELVTEAVYLPRLLELFKKHNVTKYTLIKDVEGVGSHGYKMADDFDDALSNDLIYTVCEEEKFLEMKEDIRAFEKKYGGKCFVIDAMMLLH